jgi:hypothetical protein
MDEVILPFLSNEIPALPDFLAKASDRKWWAVSDSSIVETTLAPPALDEKKNI